MRERGDESTHGPGAERPERREEGEEPGALPVGETRLVRLLDAFWHRQRRRPNLVVRPWWSTAEGEEESRVGFLVEYCPDGRQSATLVVRQDRVTVEGPRGTEEVPLDLTGGWRLGGQDTHCPETTVNYLLRLADRVLDAEVA